MADSANNRIRQIVISTGVVTTFAGGVSGYLDDTGTAAKFDTPSGLALDASSNLIVADKFNNRIRQVTPAGVVTTLAGQTNYGTTDGVGTEASFFWPSDIALDASGNMYVTDYLNHTIRKISPPLAAPDTPTIGSATAGNGSVSVAFTPPENNGGAAITEYTASCAPTTAEQFAALYVWTASQTGSGSPITVSGLTNGTTYKCEVKAKNSTGYGDYSGASAGFTPAAAASTPSGGNDNYTPPPPPPTTNVDLPTGGGTVTPTTGQTVTVTDNGKEGSNIDLPPQTAPTAGAPAPATVSINVALPGTGTIGVSSDSEGTKLGVQGVTLPGATASVSTVMVSQGSASFTATKEGQPVASLKNGIFVVSGATDRRVTVDATGPDTRIGVTSSDTIVVPAGSTHVAGTSVDLPPPTASGGAASTISVKIGAETLTIQSSQPDTKMTFKVVDIGGVQTPVLAVTGAAQVTGSGDNQPIVSIAGNVIRTGKSGGGQSGMQHHRPGQLG